MQIQVNSDHTIETTEAFVNYVRRVIEHTIHNYQSQVTRIEVHFSDENGGKVGSNDKRCLLEARLAGRKPIAVTEQADTLDGSIHGASEKLKHALMSILGRQLDSHRQTPIM